MALNPVYCQTPDQTRVAVNWGEAALVVTGAGDELQEHGAE